MRERADWHQDLVAKVLLAIQAAAPRAIVMSRQAKVVRCRRPGCGTLHFVTQDPDGGGDVWFIMPDGLYGEVECKSGPAAKLDPGQRRWAARLLANNAATFCAHTPSKDDIPRVLRDVQTFIHQLESRRHERANGERRVTGAGAGGGNGACTTEAAADEAVKVPHRRR